MNEQLRTNAEEDIPQARDMGKPESLENSVADTLPYDEELELEERWLGFGGLASTLAGGIDCLAGVIRHGARNIASELADIEAELEAERLGEQYPPRRNNGGIDGDAFDRSALPLPWQVKPSGGSDLVHDDELKEKILSLSTKETTFTGPYKEADTVDGDSSEDTELVLDEPAVKLIKRLLYLDKNLADMHAKSSGRGDVREARFWKNYFYHCKMIRSEYLIHDDELDAELVHSPPATPERQGKAGVDIGPVSPPRILSVGDLVLVGLEHRR